MNEEELLKFCFETNPSPIYNFTFNQITTFWQEMTFNGVKYFLVDIAEDNKSWAKLICAFPGCKAELVAKF